MEFENELDIEEELTLRQLSRLDFHTYCKYVDPKYQTAAMQKGRNIHRELLSVYEAVAKGEIKRLMVSCPPRLGKSTLGGILLPTWIVGRDQRKKFVLASYDANLASDFARKSRDVITGKKFRNVFPEFSIAEDKNTQTHWETKDRGGMYTVGVGGALTGLGGDALFIDDPIKNAEEAQSPVIQDKIIDWYDSVLSTRKQDENSSIVLTMTRWHVDDLHGKLEQKEKEGGEIRYKHVIKAIDDEGFPIIRPGKRGPQYFFKERENRSHKVRQALFQQDPIAMSGNLFKPGMERRFLESDFEKVGGMNKSDITLGLFVDPAFSTSIKSDDCVVALIGQHKLTRDFYIFDIFADTQAPSVAINMIFNMAMKWDMKGYNKPFVSIENVALNRDQTKFKQSFMDEMNKRNQWFTLHDFFPHKNKGERIKFELEPLRSMNKMYFNENLPAEVKKRTMEQFYRFPNHKHDDIIDTIAQGVYQLTRGVVSKDERKKAENVSYDPVTNQRQGAVFRVTPGFKGNNPYNNHNSNDITTML